jgi:uncharacterized protein (TIGR03435 family)
MILAYLSPLANHLWQSTLCACVAWLLTLTLRKNRAAVRYWLWLAASAKFLIPFSLLVGAGSQLGWRTAPSIAQPQFSFVMEEISKPFVLPAPAARLVGERPASDWFPAILFGVWLGGFAIRCVCWLRLWRRIRAIRRTARPLSLNLPIEVLSSPARLEPGVFGIREPVLLLPEGITERLTPAQLEAVVAHELCHVRRRDNLTATIHMVVEAIFWFHPLMWWIRERLVEERERACDEEVLRVISQPEIYAEGILNVCRFYLESPLVSVSGITGSNLKKRIEKIMARHTAGNLDPGRKLLLATAGMLVVAGPILAGLLNVPQSQAQSRARDTANREFDAVSVKPYLPKGPISEGCDSHGDPGMLALVGCTLKDLVDLAYGLKSYQSQAKGPAWIETDRYAIQARSTTPATEAGMMRMLQPVLAARFHLIVHWEARQASVYVLEAANGGPKLQPASNTSRCGVVNVRQGTFKTDFLTLDDFAEALQEFVVKDHPVINRAATDKEGQYKFDLAYSLGDDLAAGPSIFSALPDQLGLTLKPGKAPIQTLVIDHAQRPEPN